MYIDKLVDLKEQATERFQVDYIFIVDPAAILPGHAPSCQLVDYQNAKVLILQGLPPDMLLEFLNSYSLEAAQAYLSYLGQYQSLQLQPQPSR